MLPADTVKSTKERPTLSVVGICCNEEKDLPGFLEALLDWVDEIILIDDGSTDQSEAIARSAGDKVRFIQHPRSVETGFSGLRNHGIELSRSDWILNMDIDERPSPELRKEILERIGDESYSAFRYRRLNYFLHRPMKAGGWDSWNNPQLARREAHRYEGIIHEKSVIDAHYGRIGQLSAYMLHLNDDGYSERMRKSFQYCQLEAEMRLHKGSRIRSWELAVRPVVEFLKKFLFKRGFVDGTPGLISALHAACSEFRTLALVWDKQNAIPREKLEPKDQRNSDSVK